MPGDKEASAFLNTPVSPVKIDPAAGVDGLVRGMRGSAFQGRNLGRAADVWEKMIEDKTVVFLGIAGALIPAGMREVFAYLIGNRYVDCVVSTGANLFHDLFETLGGHHCQGDSNVSDLELNRHKIDRIYDVFLDDDEFSKGDEFIAEFASRLGTDEPPTTREFFHLLGGELAERSQRDGILSSAYKAGVPVYCPAIADSSVGIALVLGGARRRNRFLKLDVIRDVFETADMARQAERAGGRTGAIYLGGGTPKNFIQQTHVTTCYLGDSPEQESSGHKYAIQLITDPPHWGGLSGCTFEEAQSWGKIAEGADKITVYCDATISLPLIASAVASRKSAEIAKRVLPQFGFSRNGVRIEFGE